MANFEAFRRNFSSSTYSEIGKSEKVMLGLPIPESHMTCTTRYSPKSFRLLTNFIVSFALHLS